MRIIHPEYMQYVYLVSIYKMNRNPPSKSKLPFREIISFNGLKINEISIVRLQKVFCETVCENNFQYISSVYLK